MELLYLVLGLLVLYLFMSKCGCRRVEGLVEIEQIKKKARAQCARDLKEKFCATEPVVFSRWNKKILLDTIAKIDNIIPEGQHATCSQLLYNKSVRTCPVEFWPKCGEQCPRGSKKIGSEKCGFFGTSNQVKCVQEMEVPYTEE
jgi:hypothetical protein